jgi:hypothetical protein
MGNTYSAGKKQKNKPLSYARWTDPAHKRMGRTPRNWCGDYSVSTAQRISGRVRSDENIATRAKFTVARQEGDKAMITPDCIAGVAIGFCISFVLFLYPIARLMQKNVRQREIIERQSGSFFE